MPCAASIPMTGHYFDDTKRYIDAASLSEQERADIFENNARRVYPRLDAILRAARCGMTATAFTPDADWLPYDPQPTQPSFVPPAGSVDAHCHVFGPGDVFPYAPERKYTPMDAPKSELFKLRDFLGFDRNVIVQATCHGADNSALVDALRSADGRARGIATVRPDITRRVARRDARRRSARSPLQLRQAARRPEARRLLPPDRCGHRATRVACRHLLRTR